VICSRESRYSDSRSSAEAPEAKPPRTVATSIRVPARQGLPKRIPGSIEMPGNTSMLAPPTPETYHIFNAVSSGKVVASAARLFSPDDRAAHALASRLAAEISAGVGLGGFSNRSRTRFESRPDRTIRSKRLTTSRPAGRRLRIMKCHHPRDPRLRHTTISRRYAQRPESAIGFRPLRRARWML